ELGLAGYRGTDLTAENIGTRNFNGLPTIKIEQHDDSDEIIVRYYEDQWISGTTPQLKEVRFYTNDDYLWRREGNDYARTVAKGVESVKVAYWLNKYGTRIPLLSNLDRTVARGLVIKLKFKDRGEELFTVAFQNQQRN
ncbi:MAG: hypothetical protein KC422_21765, partial [Trueperaceae bacterium]|nr:hypothetical protein [Trueperaceae bacterium]